MKATLYVTKLPEKKKGEGFFLLGLVPPPVIMSTVDVAVSRVSHEQSESLHRHEEGKR